MLKNKYEELNRRLDRLEYYFESLFNEKFDQIPPEVDEKRKKVWKKLDISKREHLKKDWCNKNNLLVAKGSPIQLDVKSIPKDCTYAGCIVGVAKNNPGKKAEDVSGNIISGNESTARYYLPKNIEDITEYVIFSSYDDDLQFELKSLYWDPNKNLDWKEVDKKSMPSNEIINKYVHPIVYKGVIEDNTQKDSDKTANTSKSNSSTSGSKNNRSTGDYRNPSSSVYSNSKVYGSSQKGYYDSPHSGWDKFIDPSHMP